MLVSKPPSEDGFGLFRVRSPLLTESRLLSFPLLTEMFQFGRFALTALCIRAAVPQRGVFPHSEILASQPGYRLREAYRRFLRPSSPLNAKTSTVCPLTWSCRPDLDVVSPARHVPARCRFRVVIATLGFA